MAVDRDDAGAWERVEKLGFDMEPGGGIFTPADPPGLEGLIHYVMDLEALVRWFALPFRYQDQEGEWHQNEPIWTVYDERGTYLPEADRLKRTWEKVMHDG